MKQRDDIHLNEEQLLCSIIDDGDLSTCTREHLASCLSCSMEKERIEESLALMSRIAERSAPMPERKALVPQGKVRGLRSWSWFPEWRWIMTAGITAAAAVVIAFGSVMFSVGQNRHAASLYRDMMDDERLITELGQLEDNALPSIYMDISEEAYQDLDDDGNESGARLPERHAQSSHFKWMEEKLC